MNENEQQPIPLVVTTEHRGVFFGYGVPTDGPTIRLTNVRNCLYWSVNVRGFGGLAVTGPDSKSRVGPRIPAATLRGVTAVLEATPEAAEAWESAPW